MFCKMTGVSRENGFGPESNIGALATFFNGSTLKAIQFNPMEPIRIFAYGSLLNERSLRKTVPHAINIYPAKVWGFKRVFNLASHERFCPAKQNPVCVLNLEQADSETALNGLCFEMDGSSFDALIRREQIYQMHEVTVSHYDDGRPNQFARLFWAKDHDLYRYLAGSDAQKHYLNLCIRGCEKFGTQFLNDFKTSTVFWGVNSEAKIQRIWRGDF